MLEHGVGAIDGHLITSGVTVLDGQIVVFGLQVKVGVDMLLLYPIPDYSGHLVTVNIDDGVGKLDFS